MGVPTEFFNFISSLPPYAQVGTGAASGWLAGFLVMKFCKFAAVLIGGVIIIVNIAEIEGLLRTNWWNINRDAQNMSIQHISKVNFSNAYDIPPNIHDFIISLGGGALIGIGCA